MSDYQFNYCAAGCRRNGNPTVIDAPRHLCTHCEHRLRDWLREIPERHALAPTFLEHGTTDRNPESKTTKRAEAPAPMRLEIVDILDTRLGRKWQGTEPTDDRRGTIGTLLAIATETAEARHTTPPAASVTTACDFLTRHLPWLVNQDWIGTTYDELRILHRTLGDAIGEYRPRPVGECHVDNGNGPCGGNLYPNEYAGVRCSRCRETWSPEQLRILGAALGETA